MLGRSLGEKLLELQGIPTAFHSLSQALTESGQARPGAQSKKATLVAQGGFE
jgi:hypothetical protein